MPESKIKSAKDQGGRELEEMKDKSKKPVITKKLFKWLFIFLFVMIVGGVSGIFADRFLFPYLAKVSFFEKYECFKPRETEIIVQEKEIVRIEESGVINEAINRVKPSVVAIAKTKDNNKFQAEEFGSGFVITSDGLIVTNNQVVNNNKEDYVVFTQNGVGYDVKIIHIDSSSSLIFLKIEANNLPVISMGVSEDLRIGQKIISLGYNMVDFQIYASTGIVNSLNSSVINSINNEQMDNMILVDSEINTINLGGPLIDLSGKVVGINTREDNKNQITSYVLPIDFIKKPLEGVININKIERLRLGLKYVDVTPYLAKKHNLQKDYGIYLLDKDSVVIGGLASRANFKQGDLIYAINDFEINKDEDLIQILEKFSIGDEIEIKYARDNQDYTLRLKLEE